MSDGAPDGDLRRSKSVGIDLSGRSQSQRDRDRILYSQQFGRLAGVTQVALAKPEILIHNRLTHSLKVEQIGISIASRFNIQEQLNYDPASVAAACLGHDIGHPPFGHATEVALDDLLVCDQHKREPREYASRLRSPCTNCRLEDGFEGNAQSFRILAVLAVHRNSVDDPFGLDLTKSSLQAVSKYPWLRNTPGQKMHKWGAYDCDVDILTWTTGADHDGSQTLTAQVMDWADDISYAVHDIEDFFKTDLIPLNDYHNAQGMTERLKKLIHYAEEHFEQEVNESTREALIQHVAAFPRSKYDGSAHDVAALDAFRHYFLELFIGSTALSDNQLIVDPLARDVIEVLKQLTWLHVIDSPRLSAIQHGHSRIVADIFRDYERKALAAYQISGDLNHREHDENRLPHVLRRSVHLGRKQRETGHSPYSERQIVTRAVVDYIASLSDLEAYKLHSALRGREGYGHML